MRLDVKSCKPMIPTVYNHFKNQGCVTIRVNCHPGFAYGMHVHKQNIDSLTRNRNPEIDA